MPTVCAICQRVLDVRTDAYGVHYQHTLQDQAAHTPVPAEAPPGWTGGRCDFCNADHPGWELPVRDFTVPGISSHGSRGNWSACDKCAGLIRAGNWRAIEDQAVARLVALGGEERLGRVLIRDLYADLHEHITGPLRPISEGGTK